MFLITTNATNNTTEEDDELTTTNTTEENNNDDYELTTSSSFIVSALDQSSPITGAKINHLYSKNLIFIIIYYRGTAHDDGEERRKIRV